MRLATDNGLLGILPVLAALMLMLAGGSALADTPSDIATIKQAANQGDIWSQGALGLRYAKGDGVPQNFQQAFSCSQKAAELGDPTAQNTLGYLYEYGQGTPQDYAQAVAWYKKAAEQGFAIAQYNLGLKYANGEGVPQDSKEAAVWFTKAASQGLAPAQYNLGNMYGRGEGLSRSNTKAYAWFSLAATQGAAGAAENRKVLERELSDGQRESAQALIAKVQTAIDQQAKQSSTSQPIVADDPKLRSWLQNVKPAAGGK